MSVNASLLDYLETRRTVTAPFLGDPGPGEDEIARMLTIASRVPDHGKLAPWRFVLYQGEARRQVGERLAALVQARRPGAAPEELEAERKQFLPAPLTVGVISTAGPHPKIPEFEQLLSAGNACFNLVHAANALGYGAHWVTRWFAYDEEAAVMLGARPGERFVGFVHIGTPTARLEDRERPDLSARVSAWRG